MSSQFARTELLIGKEALEKLNSSKVAVFGIGGVGSYTAEALARSGIGQLDLIDNDKVSLTNLNRQLIATHSTLGKFKVDVAKERLLDINPNIIINTHNTFFSPETSKKFDFSKYDYVVDAIDTVSGKLQLIECSKEANVPIISSMGAGNKLCPELFEIADISKTSVCPLARVIRQELKKRRIKNLKVVYSKEIPIKPADSFKQARIENAVKNSVPGSIAFVPSVVGLIIAGEVIKDLIK